MCHKKRTENWLCIPQSSNKMQHIPDFYMIIFQGSWGSFTIFLKITYFDFFCKERLYVQVKSIANILCFIWNQNEVLRFLWDWNLKIYHHSTISAVENWIHNMKPAIKKIYMHLFSNYNCITLLVKKKKKKEKVHRLKKNIPECIHRFLK